MMRKALKGHVFSDGTYVPAGTIIGVPSIPHHLNQAIYEEPDEVNPARFENAKGSEAIRKYFTSIDSEYLAFGMGQPLSIGFA
jgi:cytochrome P450